MSHSLSDLLLLYAQQFEDQHAPQNMTIALREAAKELDRLQAGGCARDQSTTQYCAEAAGLAQENERLRAALLGEETEHSKRLMEVDRLTAEVERLRAAAPHIKELYAIITDQAAEIEKLRNDVRLAVMSDGEECKLLTHINEALIAAPTVDVDVIVPDRDYSQMTPKDCYEAGLLDGVYQAREAIKKASRAAINKEPRT